MADLTFALWGPGGKAFVDGAKSTFLGDDERLKEEQERAEVLAGFVKMRTKNSKAVLKIRLEFWKD